MYKSTLFSREEAPLTGHVGRALRHMGTIKSHLIHRWSWDHNSPRGCSMVTIPSFGEGDHICHRGHRGNTTPFLSLVTSPWSPGPLSGRSSSPTTSPCGGVPTSGLRATAPPSTELVPHPPLPYLTPQEALSCPVP